MTKNKETRRLYWRNVVQLIRRGPIVFEQTMRVMGIYLHFREQVDYLEQSIKRQITSQKARISMAQADYVQKGSNNITEDDPKPDSMTKTPTSDQIKTAS
jgi:hypothetical protein